MYQTMMMMTWEGVQNTLKFDYISSEQQLYAGIERFYAGGAQIYGHSWKKL